MVLSVFSLVIVTRVAEAFCVIDSLSVFAGEVGLILDISSIARATHASSRMFPLPMRTHIIPSFLILPLFASLLSELFLNRC